MPFRAYRWMLTPYQQSGREYGEECSWKLLGDLHTYAHKLPAVCFQIREFSKDGTTRTDEELLLQHDTAASTAAQQVKERPCLVRLGLGLEVHNREAQQESKGRGQGRALVHERLEFLAPSCTKEISSPSHYLYSATIT